MSSLTIGLEFKHTLLGIYVHQCRYAKDLLSMAGFAAERTANTAMEINVEFSRDDGSFLSDATLYCNLVGSLIYLTMTHPDTDDTAS